MKLSDDEPMVYHSTGDLFLVSVTLQEVDVFTICRWSSPPEGQSYG